MVVEEEEVVVSDDAGGDLGSFMTIVLGGMSVADCCGCWSLETSDELTAAADIVQLKGDSLF